MKFNILLFSGILCAVFASAQDMIVRTLPTEVFRTITHDAKDTSSWKWKRGGQFNLNLSQGSLSNWAAGGDNFSMAFNSYVNYFMYFKKNKHSWDNNLDMYFGYIQTSSSGSRKNDDRLDYLSKYGFQIDSLKRFFLSGLFNFRTQFFDGYSDNKLASTLLSPAYVLFSLGMDYKPVTNFSVFLSPLTSRATIVASKKLAEKGGYGVPAGKRAINALGAFSSVNYSKDIAKNVSYRGRMDLFSDYNHNPWNIDLYLTNYFTFRINKYLSATYNLDMIYDDDVKLFGKDKTSPALQVKSIIGIGFQYRLAPVAHQ